MSTESATAIPALFVSTEASHGFFHIKLHLVAVKANDLASSWESPLRGLMDARIEVSSQGSDDDTKGLYAFRVCFDLYKPDAHLLEEVSKIAKRIEAKIQKLRDQFGYPTSFSQYCGYVAKAIGVKHFARRSQRYSDVHLMPVSQGLSSIDCMERDWLVKKQERLAPAQVPAQIEA